MTDLKPTTSETASTAAGVAPLPRSAVAPARLEDIASRVGVSRSEVSRVLNHRVREGRSVGRAKQEEIWRVARELDYQPNRAAQSLARGRTDTAGILLKLDSRTELSPHYHEIIGALTYTLSEWGLNLLVVQCDADPVPSLQKLARARTCDGVLITDMEVNDPRPHLLRELDLPFLIRGSSPYEGFAAVGMDNAAVGYRAVEFLRRLGHRRIFFHNIGRFLMAGQRRWEGAERAANEFGLRETFRYEDQVYQEEDVYRFFLPLLRQPDRPTAIFAADEQAAFGVLRAAADAGLCVPNDLSVLTCLNARMMRRLNPRLSFVNVRQDEVAAEAGRTLARMLRGQSVEPRQTFLSPILEENGSCAPPPVRV